MKMNKKLKLLYLLTISLSCILLFVCGVMAQPVVVTIWTTRDPAIDNASGRYMSQLINDFEEQYPNIELDIVPYEHSVIERTFAISHYAGNPPDIVELRRHFLTSHVETEALEPLTDFYEKWEDRPNFYQNFIDDVTFNGEIMALPYFTDSLLFYYRKDLYEKHNLEVPKTWEELIENAKILNSPEENMWGFGLATCASLETPEAWFYSLLACGGQPLTPLVGGRATYDSEAGVKALQFYVDLANKYKVMPADCSTTNDDLKMGFTSGVYAQLYQGSWNLPDLVGTEFYENVGVARLPVPAENGREAIFAGGWVWAMSPLTEHKEETWEVLKFLGGTHSQTLLSSKAGTIPISKEAASDPSLPDYVSFVADYIGDAGMSFPQHEYYNELLDGVTEVIQKAIMGQIDPEQGLKETAEKFNQQYMDD